MSRLLRFALLTLLVALLDGFAPAALSAQPQVTGNAVPVTTDVQASFPQGMTFSASIPLPSPDAEVDVVQLLYRIASDSTLRLDILEEADVPIVDGRVEARTFVDLLSAFIPSGVDLTFSWEIILADGTVVETAPESTQWTDTRFEWQMRSTDQVRLYSYGASDDFATMMLTETQATIDHLESRYNLDETAAVSIWIYDSYGDFEGTLQGNARESIAGLTYQGMDAIVAIVPDGNVAEFGRVVPHEVSHQVVFSATANAYGPPPMWFNEGIALHMQIGGTDSFGEMVRKALAEGTLFDIESLDVSFPYQPRQATLAYASSWSMLLYIETTWGAEGIGRLIDAFGTDLSTDEVIQTALGVSLDELNDGWKAWISIGAPTT